jgi:phospholipid/cholesterol/gamma-HCH transport system substrate-binding protein
MKKGTVETAVGVFVLIGIVCIGYLTVKLGKMQWFGDDHYELTARFQSVAGLKPGSEVVVAGVVVGRVQKIELDTERMEAVATLKIDKRLRLSDDVIASIKTSGLIGDKYIRISPGGSDVILAPGEMITETESAIDLEDMISKYVFSGV